MINSALTRLLKQGLARGMCPLCRVAHKLDREYIWYFFDERSSHEDHINAFSRARGFCRDHTEQLRRTEVDGLQSTLGISNLYLAALKRLSADLVERSDSKGLEKEWRAKTACPACASRDAGLVNNARYLLTMLIEDESYCVRLASSGLCMPHFQLAWNASRDPQARERLARAQRAATGALLGELEEHLRKQSAEFRDEPAGSEADAWQRAIWLMTGWPPPSEPAGVPESTRARTGP